MTADPTVVTVVDQGTVDADNPWPGLAAFREADQFFFHGREGAADELTRMVLRARLTVLHGVSGLGKTSVLRAGLFPRLRREHVLPIYVRLAHAEETPAPIDQVREAIARAAKSAAIEAPAWNGDQTLWEYFHSRDAQFWDTRNRIVTPLLVFDQFEELFTLGATTAARRVRTESFLSELADLVEGRPAAHVRARLERDPEEALRFSMSDQPCKVLFSLREDFLPDLAELRASMPGITDTMCRLRHMTTAEGLRVVESAGGQLVDHDVAEKIVGFVASAHLDHEDETAEGVVEPALLSVFCRELNNKRRSLGGTRITADLVQGNKAAIISDFYERTISEGGLSPAVRLFVEDRLVTNSGFRDSVAEEQALSTPGITLADIETLIGRRLLRREDAGAHERSRLELTHDVLANAVRASRDRRKVREQQEKADAERRATEERIRREAEAQAAREQQRREVEAARTLAATQEHAATLARNLAAEEQKARAAAERHARLEQTTRRRQIGALLVVVAVVGILAVMATLTAERANRALSASDVDRVVEGEPWTLPLLARAVRLDPDSALARALLIGHLSREVIGRTEITLDGPVRSAMLNRQATRLLTLTDSGTARLWDPQTGTGVSDPLGPEHQVVLTSFNKEGSRVVTASRDGAVRVWDAISARSIGEPLSHGARVTVAAFDTAGRRILTASDDGTIRVWNPETGTPVEIRTDTEGILESAFDPTDRYVLSVSGNGDAAVWNAETGARVSRLSSGPVRHASFSRDGHRIVATLMNGTARVIDVLTGLPVGKLLQESQASIGSARFDPAGKRVLTVAAAINDDSAVARLWDAATGDATSPALAHAGRITTADFSPDGSLVLTASPDGSARLWNAATGELLGRPLQHAGPVIWAGFSPDGQRVLTASDDGTARLWEARTGAASGGALRHDGPLTSAGFSGDGATIVTAALNHARTWDARTGTVAATRIRQAEGFIVTIAAIAANGAYVATAGSLDSSLSDSERTRRAAEERAVRVWEVATGRMIGEGAHSEPLKSVRFNPSGDRVVTASADGTARVWDAASARALGDPIQHRGPVFWAAFDASGQHVVTASADGTARISDAQSGRPLRELSHCENGACAEVRSAAFSPDGSRVVTGTSDGAVRVWDAKNGALIHKSALECSGPALPSEVAPAITSVSFSLDGSRILASADAQSRLWDAKDLKRMDPCLSHEGARNVPVFSRDRSIEELQVVTTSTTDAGRVWDVRREPTVRWMLPRDREVVSASFSNDGRLVTASADRNGTARIWNTRTGKETGLVLHHGSKLAWTTFSGDGSRILTLGSDGVVQIWDVPAGSSGDADGLARLSKAVSGHELDQTGVRHPDGHDLLGELRKQLGDARPSHSLADVLMRWILADPATRTISPMSRITMPEYQAGLTQERTAATPALRKTPENLR